MRRFLESTRLTKATENLRYPNERVTCGAPPPQLLHPCFTCVNNSLLQLVPTTSALSNEVLERFGRTRHSNCAFRIVFEAYHMCFGCLSRIQKKRLHLRTMLWSSGLQKLQHWGPLISCVKCAILKPYFQGVAWFPQEHRPIFALISAINACLYELHHVYICICECTYV